VRCDTAQDATKEVDTDPERHTCEDVDNRTRRRGGNVPRMAASRIFNFSAGPAILPPEVLERAAAAVLELKSNCHADDGRGIGLSLLEISHRSAEYVAIHDAAIELVHEVLGIPRSCDVLLLQGGPSLQF